MKEKISMDISCEILEKLDKELRKKKDAGVPVSRSTWIELAILKRLKEN